VCPAGHTFDVARQGYLNLLQPQDRRSPGAGDARTVVDARGSLWAAGFGHAVVAEVVSLSEAVPGNPLIVVDLGAGTGDALGLVAASRPAVGVGIDLSVAAAARAARRFPALTWLVANADRRLPLLDGSVDLVLSIHGRRNPADCARVLKPGGALVAAVPASDDLIELRAMVQGRGLERQRNRRLIAEHEALFSVTAHREVRERQSLDPGRLRDLLHTTYRGRRARVTGLSDGRAPLDVTMASEVWLFTRL
jgi:23S rRNA (guanine745-N1)-methyltransferase